MSIGAQLLQGMIYWRGTPGTPGKSKLWNPQAEKRLRLLASRIIEGHY